jgi:predicted dehydrogenase
MAQRISRRELLAGGAAIASTLRGAIPPNEKVNLAFIGIGTYGARCLRELASHNVVAVCDVDWRPRAQMGTNSVVASEVIHDYPQARRFDDWRIMLEEMDRKIDGVVVSSTDHTHAIASITAMKMGKHVYCEKPLAHSIHEVRAMVAAERKYKVTTQTGTQGHASEDCRSIVEWVQAGAIGSVKEVHLFQIARPPDYFPSVAAQSEALTHLSDKLPIPSEVKWDLFLGPAPQRAFHPMYLPRRWRAWLDYGTGILGDHGPHYFDPVQWALDLGYPETIEAETNPEWDPERDRQTFPHTSLVRYRFPARGSQPPVDLTWHGFRTPPLPQGWKSGEPLPEGGGILIGSKGTLVFGLMYRGQPQAAVPGLVRLLPEDLDRSFERPAKTLARPKSHWLEWVDALKERQPASANFAYGAIGTEFALLGDIAIRHKGKILRFDAATGKFANSESANRMFQRKYREGWTLPT